MVFAFKNLDSNGCKKKTTTTTTTTTKANSTISFNGDFDYKWNRID